MAINGHNTDSYQVIPVPDGYRGIDENLFNRFLTFRSIPIFSMEGVDDIALKMARWELVQMFSRCEWRIPEIEATNPLIIISAGSGQGQWKALDGISYAIVNESELVDDNATRSIMIHETAHLLHHSLSSWDKTHIRELYETRPPRGDGYGETNEFEYFAEGVTSYFSCQGASSYPVHTRETLQVLDERLYAYVHFCMGMNAWQWKPIAERNVNFAVTPAEIHTQEYFYD